MIKTVFYQMTRRDWAWLIVVSAIVSFCGVFGCSYVYGQGWPSMPLWEEILLTIVFTVVAAGVFFLCDVAFAKFEASKGQKNYREFERLIPKWTVKSIIVFSLIMMVLWLPWYIANFPGAAYWDTYYQIYQVYPEHHPIAIIPWQGTDVYEKTLTDAWLVDHHPVLVTMIYGAFGWISDQLTGNWMAGVAIFTALQGIASCVVFTSAIAYLRRIGCSPALCFFCFLFFSLMPFVPTWMMCMVKDSMFSVLYVPYFMMLIEIVRTRGAFLTKRSHFVWFIVLGVVMCLLKKQAIFVVVITAVVGFIAFWLRRGKGIKASDSDDAEHTDAAEASAAAKAAENADGTVAKPAVRKDPAKTSRLAFLLQGVISLVVMVALLPYVVFPLLNIEKGGLQETLGPLFQQTARYIVDYGDEVTPEEKEAIAAVIDYDQLAGLYSWNFEDNVKYEYHLDSTPEQLMDYFAVYVSQGLKHPDSYFGAWMSLAGYYIAPTSAINIRMTTVETHLENDRVALWNPTELEGMRTGLEELYNTVAMFPVINFLLLMVLYTLWLPAMLMYVAQRRRLGARALALSGEDAADTDEVVGYPWSLLVAPQLVLLAFCIIAPVYDGRYVIPIFCIAPLMYCAMTIFLRDRDRSREEELEREGLRRALGAKGAGKGKGAKTAKADERSGKSSGKTAKVPTKPDRAQKATKQTSKSSRVKAQQKSPQKQSESPKSDSQQKRRKYH